MEHSELKLVPNTDVYPGMMLYSSYSWGTVLRTALSVVKHADTTTIVWLVHPDVLSSRQYHTNDRIYLTSCLMFNVE
jgi:hypothetical protein